MNILGIAEKGGERPAAEVLRHGDSFVWRALGRDDIVSLWQIYKMTE